VGAINIFPSILRGLVSGNYSIADTEESAQAVVVAIKSAWSAMLSIWGLNEPDFVQVGDQIRPLPDQPTIARCVGIIAQHRTKVSEGTVTCADFMEYADAISSSLDPVLTMFGLPAYGSYLQSLGTMVRNWEEQGQRLHPELNFLNPRSRSQLLAIISALIHVQPSQIMALKNPEELAGFVDVALRVQEISSKSLASAMPLTPLLTDQRTGNRADSTEQNATTINKAAKSRLVLGNEHENPQIDGTQMPRLTPRERRVIGAIVTAKTKGQSRLTGPELDDQSNTSESRKVLKGLSEKHSLWKIIIKFPEAKGDGYGLE